MDMKTKTPRALALEGLPAEWREKLIADASALGIAPGVAGEHDVMWTVVGSMINAWAAAHAAAQAAQAAAASAEKAPVLVVQAAEHVGNKAADALAETAEIGVKTFALTIEAGQADMQDALNAAASTIAQRGQEIDGILSGAFNTHGRALIQALKSAQEQASAQAVARFEQASSGKIAELTAAMGANASKAVAAREKASARRAGFWLAVLALALAAGGAWAGRAYTLRALPSGGQCVIQSGQVWCTAGPAER